MKNRFLLLFFLLPLLLSSCSPSYKKVSHVWYQGEDKWEKKGPLIVIDAGHGGMDFGAKARRCIEKSLTLNTARLVKKILNERGYHVLMTRKSDRFIPLKTRVEIANKWGASLFVSIHYNAAKNRKAKGIEVYYYDEERRRSNHSKTLASSLLSGVLKKTRAPSRGVKSGNFLVIRETKMASALVEGGFITNGRERKKLKDKRYLQKVAHGIANGITSWLKMRPRRDSNARPAA